MQKILNRSFPWLVFALFVASNFVFIFLSPNEDAALFLQTYALSSLICSFLATSIYFSIRKRNLDTIIIGTQITLMISAELISSDYISDIILYTLSASSMILAEFSISQTQNIKFLHIQRIGAAVSAVFLIYDFEAALVTRTMWFLVCFIYSIKIKAYNINSTFRIDNAMVFYSAVTCALYFGMLSITPEIFEENAKEVYILYSIVGNIVLKYQDYHLKNYIIRAQYYSMPNMGIISAIFFIAFLIALASGSNISIPLLALNGLILAGGVLRHARWN